MIRTQIQLPDELYKRAKALAADREISLAELVRNGLEHMLTALTPPGAKQEKFDLPVLNLPVEPNFDDLEWQPPNRVQKAAADAQDGYDPEGRS